MSKGRIWPAERHEYADPASGARVQQLTDYKGHSHHVYFTNDGWHDEGRRLLFGSDRENRTNLFSVELATGEITQLTDLEPVAAPRELCFLAACVNPRRPEAYFWYGREAWAVDLHSLETRPICAIHEGFAGSMVNCTADGRSLCVGMFEDLSERFRVDYLHGYVGFRETWKARPLSRIGLAPIDGGEPQVVWEERSWIGHVNTSPTQANLLTFCHEGPWDKVDNRIWLLDLDRGTPSRIRPREGLENVGHEFWLIDGEHIGYHGRMPDGNMFFGRVRHDNEDRFEVAVPHATGHIHSNDFSLVVGDGLARDGLMRLWRCHEGGLDGPRVLCQHRTSFHVQIAHAHPRFTADGRQVLYTSDVSGYCNLYLADVPDDFESLPLLEELS